MSGLAALHQAFVDGDLAAVRAALGDPPGFPNTGGPHGFGDVLEYAICWSPLALVSELLALGADPRRDDGAGFPPLIAALATDRADRLDLLRLLLDAGADPDQRGINDYTPLHYAAVRDDAAAIELLASRGGDLGARTRIDEYATPLEEALLLGKGKAAAALRRLGGG